MLVDEVQIKIKDNHLENLSKALVFIADKLSEEKIMWLLGASGALWVWGVKIVPHDLDILVSPDDLEKVKKTLQNPVLKISGIKIDVSALQIKGEELVFLDFRNQKIPVNPLERELQFYKEKPGKEEKVKLIGERLRELKKI